MIYGACMVAAAPVYRDIAPTGEMINQLLFGEMMRILDDSDGYWLKIQSLHDSYGGWIAASQVQPVAEAEALAGGRWLTGELLSALETPQGIMHVPAGASLPAYDGGQGRFGELGYRLTGAGAIDRQAVRPGKEAITALLEQWINAPYLWGGRTIMGVDCSGFTQVIFKMMGIDLLRDAAEQVTGGAGLGFLQEAHCGDLAFFDNASGHIVHVGILLNDHEIVHAAGRVRKDRIDNAGIILSETGRRTHRLRTIRRYFS